MAPTSLLVLLPLLLAVMLPAPLLVRADADNGIRVFSAEKMKLQQSPASARLFAASGNARSQAAVLSRLRENVHISGVNNAAQLALVTVTQVVESVNANESAIAIVHQSLDGIPVFGSALKVLVKPDGAFAASSGRLVDVPIAAVEAGVKIDDDADASAFLKVNKAARSEMLLQVHERAGRTVRTQAANAAAASSVHFVASAMQAAAAALYALYPLIVPESTSLLADGGTHPTTGDRLFTLLDSASQQYKIRLEQPISARAILYPIGTDQLRAAYLTTVFAKQFSKVGVPKDSVTYAIAADKPAPLEVLMKRELRSFARQYRAFVRADLSLEADCLTDVTPYPGATIANSRTKLSPRLVTINGGLNSYADPWLPSTATITQGNHVEVYCDRTQDSSSQYDVFVPNSADFYASQSDTAGNFDYTFDPDLSPTYGITGSKTQSQAAIVNTFYIINYLHDFFYDAGFTESTGNAQQVNLRGTGGAAGDRMSVSVQDLEDITDNAWMYTQPDGYTPMMTLLLFDSNTKDSAVDSSVIVHEYGHYVHMRLTPDTSSTFLYVSISEGLADFNALLFLVHDGDSLAGSYGVGTYLMNSPYYGIRRYPYSTSMSVYPLTFKHCMTSVSLPTSPAPGSYPPNAEVHAVGELWAQTFFDAYVSLQQSGLQGTFEETRKSMINLFVSSLIFTPAAVTFENQRDAFIAKATDKGIQVGIIFANAFAKRGFGVCANGPTNGNMYSDGTAVGGCAGLVESFLAAGVKLTGASATASGTTGTDFTLSLTLNNPHVAPIPAGYGVQFTSTSSAVSFPSGAVAIIPSDVAASNSITVTVPVSVSFGSSTSLSSSFSVASNNASCSSDLTSFSVTFQYTGSTTPAASSTAAAPAASSTAAAPAASSTAAAPATASTAAAPAASSTAAAPAPTPSDGATSLSETFSGSTTALPTGYNSACLSPTNCGGYFFVDTTYSVLTTTGPTTTEDYYVTIPLLAVTTSTAQLAFVQSGSIEKSSYTTTAYDGGVVEISINGGAYQDVTQVATMTPGYNAVLSSNQRNVFSGSYSRVAYTINNFVSSAIGSTIQVRFRFFSDSSVSSAYWDIDNLEFSQ